MLATAKTLVHPARTKHSVRHTPRESTVTKKETQDEGNVFHVFCGGNEIKMIEGRTYFERNYCDMTSVNCTQHGASL